MRCPRGRNCLSPGRSRGFYPWQRSREGPARQTAGRCCYSRIAQRPCIVGRGSLRPIGRQIAGIVNCLVLLRCRTGRRRRNGRRSAVHGQRRGRRQHGHGFNARGTRLFCRRNDHWGRQRSASTRRTKGLWACGRVEMLCLIGGHGHGLSVARIGRRARHHGVRIPFGRRLLFRTDHVHGANTGDRWRSRCRLCRCSCRADAGQRGTEASRNRRGRC